MYLDIHIYTYKLGCWGKNHAVCRSRADQRTNTPLFVTSCWCHAILDSWCLMLGHSVLIHTRQLPINPTTNSNPPPLLATPQKGFFREILGPKFEIHCKKNLISENPNYWMLVGSALLWRQNKRKKLMWVVLTQPLFSPPVFWSKNEKNLTKILSMKRSVVQTHFLEQKLGAWAHIQPNKNTCMLGKSP